MGNEEKLQASGDTEEWVYRTCVKWYGEEKCSYLKPSN